MADTTLNHVKLSSVQNGQNVGSVLAFAITVWP